MGCKSALTGSKKNKKWSQSKFNTFQCKVRSKRDHTVKKVSMKSAANLLKVRLHLIWHAIRKAAESCGKQEVNESVLTGRKAFHGRINQANQIFMRSSQSHCNCRAGLAAVLNVRKSAQSIKLSEKYRYTSAAKTDLSFPRRQFSALTFARSTFSRTTNCAQDTARTTNSV